MRRSMIVKAVALAGVVAVSAPALATHNTPAKANKFVISFVRSYAQCTSPNDSHNPPLALPACRPPSSNSPVLSFGPKGFGQAIGVVKLNALKQATDVQLIAKFADVRNGDDGTGTPFDGILNTTATIRTTDHNCVSGPANSCTMTDSPFPVALPCGSFASPPLPPGKCSAKTSANAVVSGAVAPGVKANIGLSQLQVFQGSNLAFEGGLYLP